MKHNDPISKIMSRNVITAHHGDPLSKVRALVREHGVHHIPIVNGDQLVGIIAWSDILRVSFGDVAVVVQNITTAELTAADFLFG